jgi:hypothetical protein
MDATVFLTTIVRPTLIAVGAASDAAEMLLMGTAAQESNLVYTKQIGGPALGYFQMEPATYDDCWTNYLHFRPDLAARVRAVRTAPGTASADDLVTDHVYAAAMARVRYMRVAAPIPADPRLIAAYWKQHYNTPLGAGTVEDFIGNWNRYLTPQPYQRIN